MAYEQVRDHANGVVTHNGDFTSDVQNSRFTSSYAVESLHSVLSWDTEFDQSNDDFIDEDGREDSNEDSSYEGNAKEVIEDNDDGGGEVTLGDESGPSSSENPVEFYGEKPTNYEITQKVSHVLY